MFHNAEIVFSGDARRLDFAACAWRLQHRCNGRFSRLNLRCISLARLACGGYFGQLGRGGENVSDRGFDVVHIGAFPAGIRRVGSGERGDIGYVRAEIPLCRGDYGNNALTVALRQTAEVNSRDRKKILTRDFRREFQGAENASVKLLDCKVRRFEKARARVAMSLRSPHEGARNAGIHHASPHPFSRAGIVFLVNVAG